MEESEKQKMNFEKLFKIVESYNIWYIEKCQQLSKRNQYDSLAIKSTIQFLSHNLKYLKKEFLESDSQKKIEKLSKVIPECFKDLLSENLNLREQLERQKFLNLKYRQGYTTSFSVYLSTILWMKSCSYHSSEREINVFKQIPTELVRIIGDYSGVLWTIKSPSNLTNT